MEDLSPPLASLAYPLRPGNPLFSGLGLLFWSCIVVHGTDTLSNSGSSKYHQTNLLISQSQTYGLVRFGGHQPKRVFQHLQKGGQSKDIG